MSDGEAGNTRGNVRPSREIDELLKIMTALRNPQTGCPWDVEQSFRSIVPYTIEEAFEVADAVERGSMTDLCDELGDLLLQVVFHAQMASERGAFDFSDVVSAITIKMIRRHPHVFGASAKAVDGVVAKASWDEIKAKEKALRAASTDRAKPWLDDVPSGFPALALALKLQARAAKVGFDWNDPMPVLCKVEEELREFLSACEEGVAADVEAELGDLMFSLVNLARHLKIDPEAALRRTNLKFRQRFGYVETALNSMGSSLQDASLDEMETLWQQAKSAAAPDAASPDLSYGTSEPRL